MNYNEAYYDVQLPIHDPQQLGEFLSRKRLRTAATNLSHSVTFHRLEVVEQVGASGGSAEHSAFLCLVYLNNGPDPFKMVVKFKRGSDGLLQLMSRSHVATMCRNFRTVDRFCADMDNLRTTLYIVLSVGNFYVWLEEYLPNFQKFLEFPHHRDLNKKLAVSSSQRVTTLQKKMLEAGISPIADVQGGYLHGSDEIVLSDIETAESLGTKFMDLDAESVEMFIREKVSPEDKFDYSGVTTILGYVAVAAVAVAFLFNRK